MTLLESDFRKRGKRRTGIHPITKGDPAHLTGHWSGNLVDVATVGLGRIQNHFLDWGYFLFFSHGGCDVYPASHLL